MAFNPPPINFPKPPINSPYAPPVVNIPRLPLANLGKYNPPKFDDPRFPINRGKYAPSRSDKSSLSTAYKPDSDNRNDGWALSKFMFEVDLGMDMNIGFQTCDGLEAGTEAYEFRDGNSTDFFKQKRPGQVTFGNITLKKGMFANDKSLYTWFNNVATGALFGDMRDVTIRLLETGRGNGHNTVFTWKLKKAFVVKYTPTTMDAHDGDEVAVEEIEIACQSWTMD